MGFPSWQLRLGLVLIPWVVYTVLMFNEQFPPTETRQSGASTGEMFKATFTSPLGIARVQEAAFESLRRAGELSHHWEVRTPQEYEGGRWDFAGWSARKFRLGGIAAVEFEISNF